VSARIGKRADLCRSIQGYREVRHKSPTAGGCGAAGFRGVSAESRWAC